MNFNSHVVNKFINNISPILSRSPFGLLVKEGEPEEPIYYNEIEEKILDIDNGAEIRYGISKMVISAPSLRDVVIKIPFNGIYDFYYDDYLYPYDKDDYLYPYDKTDITFFDGEDHYYYYTQFNSAENNINNSDYCATELEKYNTLKTFGLDNFVAKTEFYNTSNNIRFYLQEKAMSMEEDFKKRRSSFKSKNTARQWIEDEMMTIDVEWAGMCIDYYGEELTKQFLDYCNYQDDIIISDPHMGNFGYRKNGEPIVIDFSGFAD